jgi:WXXGXW repeat (2 copies)
LTVKRTLLLAVSSIFLTVGAANAQIVVRIGPPPPRPVEVVPEVPHEHRDWIWVPGYHRWDGHAYVWVPGAYRRPPHPGAVWVPGDWREERGGHVWHEGYWR